MSTVYQIFHNWKIPHHALEDYAHMIATSKRVMSECPAPSTDFFIRRLRRIATSDQVFDAVNVLVSLDKQPIGWGQLSFQEGDWPDSEVYLYVEPEHRRQGIGSTMMRLLFESVPAVIREVGSPVIGDGHLFLMSKYNAEIIREEHRAISTRSSWGAMTLDPATSWFIAGHDPSHDETYHHILAIETGMIHSEESFTNHLNFLAEAESRIGTKHLYVTREETFFQFLHIMLDFEENEKLAFLEPQSQPLGKSHHKLIEDAFSILRDETNVDVLMWLEYDEDNPIASAFHFRYLNTNITHRLTRPR